MVDPKISVLMSVYNGEEYLREAVESILKQTFKDFEFIIIDDGSYDSTKEILKSYNDPRIRLMENKKNIGLTKSLNKGIDLCKGKYIARMDGDDRSLKGRLNEQFHYLEKNSEVGVLGTWAKNIGDSNGLMKFPTDQKSLKYPFINQTWIIAHSSAMIRRSVIKEKKIYYDEKFKYSQDYKYWLDLNKVTKIANIAKVFLEHRSHKNSVTNKMRNDQENCYYEIIEIEFNKLFGRPIFNYEKSIIKRKYGNVTVTEMGEYLNLVKRFILPDIKKKIIIDWLRSKMRKRRDYFSLLNNLRHWNIIPLIVHIFRYSSDKD